MPSSPATTLGRYELITRIGEGGMAEVQLAIQRGPAGFEKLVVVKVIHPSFASKQQFVDMLLEEARLAALVKHPNVVDIYDLGQVDGRYYIAMEYLEGEPLLALLRAGRDKQRLDPLSTARLIAEAAEGLAAAHDLRSLSGEPIHLVHHDISLGNIVVLYNGQVKLVDFGVAKAGAAQGALQGKFSYMAAEKLRGQPGDRRSDIFSLGVVLWEALTLKRLFRGATDQDTIQQVLSAPIGVPSEVNPDVPVELDPIVLRALERDPDRRYQTATEVAADLEDVLRLRGYGRRNDAIAKYMQDTFREHLTARKKLLQEVSSKGTASSEVLDLAFSDASAGKAIASSMGEFSVKFRRPSGAIAIPRAPTEADRPVRAVTSRPMRHDPPRMTDVIGKLDHAGSQPLFEMDQLAGAAPIAPTTGPASLADLEPDVPSGGGGVTASQMPVKAPQERSPQRARVIKLIATALIAIAVLLSVAFAALRIFAASDDDEDDHPHPRMHAPRPVAPVVMNSGTAGSASAVGSGSGSGSGGGSGSGDGSASGVGSGSGSGGASGVGSGSGDGSASGVGSGSASGVGSGSGSGSGVGSGSGSGSGSGGSATAASDTDPPLTAEDHYRVGSQQFGRGELTKAIASFKAAQKADPTFAPAWRALALLHDQNGDHDAARHELQRYLQLAPNAVDAAQMRAKLDSM